MPIEADLHTHSHHSDGLLTPAELVASAAAAGLSLLALTDHDTVDGIREARASAPPGLEVLGGAELSSSWKSREIHLLVYGLDPDDVALREALEPLRQERRRRAERIVQKLNKAGVPVTMEEVDAIAQASGAGDRTSIGRPHIADAIVRHGAAIDLDEAFVRYLRRGQPGYVARETLSVAQALELARARSAAIVVAHPGLNLSDADTESLVREGLHGIEVHHPKHGDDVRRRMAEMAKRLGVVGTGGSDFHGEGRNRHRVGEAGVARETVDRLRELALRR
ncbi:MAG: PHP domain-containing protein [Candidatus Polarisedimenticolia bacterium]